MQLTVATLSGRAALRLASAVLWLASALCASGAEIPPSAPAPRISLHDGALTLVSDGATLGSILKELARQGRFELHMPAALDQQAMTISLDSVPLDAALRRLLEGTSFLVMYDAQADPGERRLKEVRVLSTGGPGSGAQGTAPLQPPTETEPARVNDVERLLEEGAKLRESFEAARRLAPGSPASEVPKEKQDDSRAKRLDKYLQEARTEADPEARRQALASLMELGPNDPRAREVVLEALEDAHPRVRREALARLVSVRDQLPSETLVSMALSDDDPEVRALAVHLAARSLPPDEAAVVLRQAKADRNMWVRATARDLLRSLR